MSNDQPEPVPEGDGSTSESDASAAVRRRLEDPGAKKTEGRFGCLLTGAILGIIFGATFAFYGLPPILRAIYGEEHIGLGETYSGDGKSLRVESLRTPGDGSDTSAQAIVHVFLSVRTNKTWNPQIDDFQLELSSGGDWIEPLPSVPAVVESSLLFPLGEERLLLLRFRLPEANAEPYRLHLAEPRVRFDLPPVEDSR